MAPERVILFVEDNPEDQALLQLAFEEQGVRATLEPCRDGEEAWRVLALPDAGRRLAGVILDLKVPKVSGLELLARIRRQPGLAHLKTVILTSSDDPKDIGTAKALGVSDYVLKPLEYSGLADVVERLLRVFIPKEPR